MTISLNIDFKPFDFDQINKVLTTLSQDGWEVVQTKDFTIKKPSGLVETTSKSYILKRTI